jgi:menaquinone-dependent protoporphyrinogen oxidase
MGKITRRGFLKASAVSLGASTLVCSGLGFAASRAPRIEHSTLSCGEEKTMEKKYLIAYATRAGSTVEIAEAIGKVFCENGVAVDVRPVKEVKSTDGYSGVIIGSAIRMGRWLPEAVKFVEEHRSKLEALPTAFFLASYFLREDTPEMRNTVAAYLDPVREILEPDHTGLFPGKMDYSKLSWIDRQAAKMVKAPEGDARDWEAVQSWAQELLRNGFGPHGA